MRKLERRIAEGLAGAVLLLVTGHLILTTTVYTRMRLICVECRVEKKARRILGAPFDLVTENDFTRWHRLGTPSHTHHWARAGCTVGKSVLGTTTYFGCGPVHPLVRLPPETQLQFAKTAAPEEWLEFMRIMRSGVPDEKRTEVDRVYEMIFGAGR